MNTINEWVSEQTNQKIPTIISSRDVHDLTRLILVNAIYFKANWEKQFTKEYTKLEDFNIAEDKVVKVPLMCLSESYAMLGFSEELKSNVVELQYVKNEMSMFIILPDDKVTNLQEVEGKLNASHIARVERAFAMRQQKVVVWLPKFKLDESLCMSETLSALGMDEMFSDGKADLSGIDGTRELFVSEVFHRAYVEVNEEGTEAAAVTAVRTCVTMCARPISLPFLFRADHPFLFFIRNNRTRSVLFLGKLVNP